MVYKGMFSFDKKNHAGECEINDNNNIYLTINEGDFKGHKKKITGIAGAQKLTLYNCLLVDNGIGYYKYLCGYAIKSKLTLKHKNVDFSKHIQKFRFTFEGLNEWLMLKTIIEEDSNIKLEIPSDIILYKTEKLEIKIKFIKQTNKVNINEISNIKIQPYICVDSKKEMKFRDIMNYIQLVTRFFAILIGYSGPVRTIKFIKSYNGKPLYESYDDMIINTDFSNRYNTMKGYPCTNLRTYYKDLPNNITDIFSKWYDLYKNTKYTNALVYYFNPYNANTTEDNFLILCKCLEKLSIANDNLKEKKRKNKKFHKLICDFYDKYEYELIKAMNKNKFKKVYIRNIKEIHENIANSIVYEYDMRITLSKRIKDLDDLKQLNNIFKVSHCTLENQNLSIYDYIANTRNYYAHLSSSKFIIKEDYLPAYIRILEKIFIRKILLMIMNNDEFVENVIKRDEYLTIYDYIDL